MAKANYQMDPAGLNRLGNSAGIQQAAMRTAQAVAASARTLNHRGEYEARPRTVTVGWQRESRAGAEVVETQVGRGPQKRALARAAAQRRTR